MLAEGQLNNLGANVLFVVPGNTNARRQGVTRPKTLVLEDAEAIATQVPSVKRVAPVINTNQVVQAGARSSTGAVFGATSEFLGARVRRGQGPFHQRQGRAGAKAIAVLGSDLRTKLFPTGSAIGQQVRIGNQSFEVVGVMAPKGPCSAATRMKTPTSPSPRW